MSSVKSLWSLCKTDRIPIPNSSYQWSIILMEIFIEVWEGLICFSSLLSLMSSVVEQSMSVEFLDDMRVRRAAKMSGDKARIQNYADGLKKCSSKNRVACH